MSKENLAERMPSAVSSSLVLKLIRAKLDNDDHDFKQVSIDIAQELSMNGDSELSEWILAQYRLIRTFEVTD